MGTPKTGREVLIGVKKGVTWGTAVTLGANDGILCRAVSPGLEPELLEDTPLGTAWSTDTLAGRQTSDGPIEGDLRYDGNEWRLIAQAMGTAGAPTQLGGVAAYQHRLQLADGHIGLFSTMARHVKSDLVFEHPSVKPSSVTLTGGKLIPSTFAIALIGSGLVQNGAGGPGPNTPAAMGSVTYRDKRNRVIGDLNAYARFNAQSAAALAPADNIYIADFELVLSRPEAGDHVLNQSNMVTEPIGTGNAEVSLTLHFPQLVDQSAALVAALGSNPPTPLKMEVYFQGGLAATGQNFRLLIRMPQVIAVGGIPPVSGPGKIDHPITFRLSQALVAPTGMAGLTNPFEIWLVNTLGTDLLA